MIKYEQTEPPAWGTKMWKVLAGKDELLLFGYTDLSLITNEIYLFLELKRKPRYSELRNLRPLFWKWVEGSTAVISVDNRTSERFAEFFGFADSGYTTIDGKLFVGYF